MDVGSTFSLEASFAVDVADAVDAVDVEPDGSLQGLHALVLDDSAVSREMLTAILSQWGLTVTCAGSAVEALLLLVEADASGAPVDVLFVDTHMPDIDGIAFLETLRGHEQLLQPRAVLLTSGRHGGEAAICRRLNVAACLEKPIDQLGLWRAATKALRPLIASEADASSSVSEPTAARILRVLLVEDNPFNQAVATALLEREGHVVHVSNDGKEAVAAFKTGAFDLILMDVQMPVMDGLEATAAIRAVERIQGGRVTILGTTALVLEGDRKRCLAAGMDAHLPKPIRLDRLRQVLQTLSTPRDLAPDARVGESECLEPERVLADVGGDLALLGRVIPLYREQSEELLLQLEAATAVNDRLGVEHAAHALAGVIAHWSEGRAVALAREVELAARSGSLEPARLLGATLRGEVRALAVNLTEVLAMLQPV